MISSTEYTYNKFLTNTAYKSKDCQYIGILKTDIFVIARIVTHIVI